MSLLFIRHAETALAGTFCGHSDPPVNQRGRAQIETLLSSLRETEIQRVYTSDLRRAATTAAALAEAHAVPITPRAALREISFGAWEGLRWAEIEARDADYAQRWLDRYPELPAPDGERFVDFKARVLAEVAELEREAGDELAAVVTHAGVLRVVLEELYGTDRELAQTLTQQYCCFFRYPPRPLA